MPKMPKSVQIGPWPFEVLHSHDAIVALGKAGVGDLYGMAQLRVCRIVVDEGYPLCREQQCLLHEVIHAIHTVYDLDELKVGDEHYVRLLAGALFDTLRRNPELMAYLTAPNSEV